VGWTDFFLPDATERGSWNGDLTERTGSSLAPDQCEVLSNGRDPDFTDEPGHIRICSVWRRALSAKPQRLVI